MSKLVKVHQAALVLQGFTYRIAGEYVKVRSSVDAKRAHDILRRMPFDTAAEKMFQDLLTARRVSWEVRENFPALYAITAKRDGQPVILPLDDAEETGRLTGEALLAILEREGELLVRPCYNVLQGRAVRLACREGAFLRDDAPVERSEVAEYLNHLPHDVLVMKTCLPAPTAVERYGRCPVAHVSFTRAGQAEAYVTDHADDKGRWRLYSNRPQVEAPADDDAVTAAIAVAQRLHQKFPEVPYLHVSLLLGEDGPSIWQMDTGKDLIWRTKDPEAIRTFLERQHHVKREKMNPFKRLGKYVFSLYAKRKGFLDYMYRNWLRGLKDDNTVTTTTAQEKKWAHERGFYSYRIKQYGLTEENWRDMLSDYQYKRLRPINGPYQKWLWDKVFMYHVMAPYHDYLPQHYYRILPDDNGGNMIVPFPPVPQEEATVDGIVRLLKKEGRLVLKQDIGSHGKGFYKLSWDEANAQVLMNEEPCSEADFRTFLTEMKHPCFLSEFVKLHPDIAAIYSDVVSTIRVMVIDLGNGPQIQSSFFRIASSGSATDNLDSGGMVARVDVETGRFYGTEALHDHIYTPCTIHPDSGLPLEGVLPHWDMVRKVVTEVATYLYPMEYLGFDIVITPEGFQILEINTHQDMHRYPEYPQAVKDYFKKKCAMKEKALHRG